VEKGSSVDMRDEIVLSFIRELVEST
jgi:hypothetical protein